MKNVFRKLLIVGMVATSVVGLSACGVKQDENDKNKFYIDGLETAYALHDEFVVVGKTLNIPLEDGTTKEIVVTDEMVKQTIDVLSLGEQTLIIEYEGVEYKFVIEICDTVVDYSFDIATEYFVGDTFDLSDVYMTVEWKSGKEELIPLNNSMLVGAPDMRYAGNKTVTIEFNDKEYQFVIAVNRIN
jgi:methyl coenzyme M reductase subunit D